MKWLRAAVAEEKFVCNLLVLTIAIGVDALPWYGHASLITPN